MKTIGVSEARIRFSELLKAVARGDSLTITKHRRPAALLAPMDNFTRKRSHAEIVKDLRDLRRRVKPAGMSVREMIKRGRRF
jgi:prevent-host-death family protein